MPEIQDFLDGADLNRCDSPKKRKEVMPSFVKKTAGTAGRFTDSLL